MAKLSEIVVRFSGLVEIKWMISRRVGSAMAWNMSRRWYIMQVFACKYICKYSLAQQCPPKKSDFSNFRWLRSGSEIVCPASKIGFLPIKPNYSNTNFIGKVYSNTTGEQFSLAGQNPLVLSVIKASIAASARP